MLIQSLVAITILFISASALMGLIHSQNNQISRLQLKSDLIDLKESLKTTLSDSAVCTYNLNSLNSNVPGSLGSIGTPISLLNGLKKGSLASSDTILQMGTNNRLIPAGNVTDIQLTLEGTLPNFIGELKVQVKHKDFIFRPVVIPGIRITSNATGTQIIDCSSGTEGGSGGASSVAQTLGQAWKVPYPDGSLVAVKECLVINPDLLPDVSPSLWDKTSNHQCKSVSGFMKILGGSVVECFKHSKVTYLKVGTVIPPAIKKQHKAAFIDKTTTGGPSACDTTGTQINNFACPPGTIDNPDFIAETVYGGGCG